MKRSLVFVAACLSLALAVTAQKTQLLHFYVEAGAYQRINTPVCINLEGLNKSDTLSYQLFEKIKGQLKEKPFQVETGYVPLLWWILDGTTNAGQKREFFLYSAAPVTKSNTITTELTADNIVLKIGNSEILNYRKSVLYPPAGVDSAYKRSGFIHPLYPFRKHTYKNKPS